MSTRPSKRPSLLSITLSNRKALSDLLAFEEAIREGIRLVNLEETLVIVTADHSHSFTLVAEPSRSKSVLDHDTEYGAMVREINNCHLQ